MIEECIAHSPLNPKSDRIIHYKLLPKRAHSVGAHRRAPNYQRAPHQQYTRLTRKTIAIAFREERLRQHGAKQQSVDRTSSTLLGDRSVRMGLGAFWHQGDFGIGVHFGIRVHFGISIRAHVGAPLRMMSF